MTSLSCGNPAAQVINWSSHRDHLDRQVLTCNWSYAYKRSHIYLSVLSFLPPPFFSPWDSSIHPLTCRNPITSISESQRFCASSSGTSTLFHQTGFRHYFWFGCSKRDSILSNALMPSCLSLYLFITPRFFAIWFKPRGSWEGVRVVFHD